MIITLYEPSVIISPDHHHSRTYRMKRDRDRDVTKSQRDHVDSHKGVEDGLEGTHR